MLHFICDTLRTAVSGVVRTARSGCLGREAISTFTTTQASRRCRRCPRSPTRCPGLGIVAAVLGVVITMGALGGPPEEIGQKVAAALVGTFLGILLSYGVVGPIAANLTRPSKRKWQFYQMMRAGLMAFAKGMAPMIAVEFARRAIPHDCRPTFKTWKRRVAAAVLARRRRRRHRGRMASNPVQPIIIIKKKVAGHGGHHGGAWKVAYADFVTAMMALFIVLWLLSSSEQVQKAVGGYFTDPNGQWQRHRQRSARRGQRKPFSGEKGHGEAEGKDRSVNREVSAFKKIKENVHITVTGEGLRVELVEGNGSTFFESGSPHPSEFGREILAILAAEVGKLPNKVTIEGHTDAKPFPSDEYSNWELSADRANAARRWMTQNGLQPEQVTQVRGFAAQSLRIPNAPEDPQNRRVTVIIQYAPSNPVPKLKEPSSEHAEACRAGEKGRSTGEEGRSTGEESRSTG